MTLDGFFPYVVPEVLGCPDPVTNQAICSAAHDFCRRTLLWTELQSPITLVLSTRDYTVTVPTDSVLVAIKDVWMGSTKLLARTLVDLGGWNTGDTGVPLFYNQAVDRAKISVFPVPNSTAAGTTIALRACYAPTLTALTLPDFLGAHYMEVIAAGAKARLMTPPMTGWSNPQMGLYYQRKFEDGISAARIWEAHERVPATSTVRMRSFA